MDVCQLLIMMTALRRSKGLLIAALRGEGQVCRRDSLEGDARWRLKRHLG